MGIEHVLQTEVTATVEVLPAEVLNELEVIQTVRQRHGLLQANVWKSEMIQNASLIGKLLTDTAYLVF